MSSDPDDSGAIVEGMAKKSRGIQEVLERVVSKVLDAHLSKLREELVREVIAEAGSQLSGLETGSAPVAGGDQLLKAVSAIHSANTQRDVLRALLDAATSSCARIALFVVKGSAAIGWQGRGFSNNDAIRDFQLDTHAGPVARVLESHTGVSAKASEIGKKFTSEFGVPEDDKCLLLPLLLKEKVAALIYADGGANALLDRSSLELLILSTGTWLEVAAQRKVAPKESAVEGVPGADKVPVARAAAAQAAPSFSDPFAAHVPLHNQSSAAGIAANERSEPGAEGDSADSSETGIHKKAQRFARLLVDEIKLYNQAKVAEGRLNKDLYDRLREDIDKSRTSYQKRFGNTPAAGGDYFNLEIIRSLAEDDVSLLGANFKR